MLYSIIPSSNGLCKWICSKLLHIIVFSAFGSLGNPGQNHQPTSYCYLIYWVHCPGVSHCQGSKLKSVSLEKTDTDSTKKHKFNSFWWVCFDYFIMGSNWAQSLSPYKYSTVFSQNYWKLMTPASNNMNMLFGLYLQYKPKSSSLFPMIPGSSPYMFDT